MTTLSVVQFILEASVSADSSLSASLAPVGALEFGVTARRPLLVKPTRLVTPPQHSPLELDGPHLFAHEGLDSMVGVSLGCTLSATCSAESRLLSASAVSVFATESVEKPRSATMTDDVGSQTPLTVHAPT